MEVNNKISSVEIAVTGRSICPICRKKIAKGTPRGVYNYRDDYNRQKKSFLCYKCAMDNIKWYVDNSRILKRDLKKFIKKSTKEIILMELDNENR